MSKKMLWAATLPGCFVLAFVWATITFSGSSLANPPDGDGNHNHGGGGGGGGSVIPVTVTFEDRPGDRVMSDCYDCPADCECLSPYIDEVDRVKAKITKDGHFNLGVPKARGNESVIRRLFFDFSDCFPDGECDSFSGLGTGSMKAQNFDLTTMDVGEVMENLIVSGTFKPSPDINARKFFFDPARCPDSTSVTVRRIAADTWEIEAGPDDVVCLEEAVGGTIVVRLYHMPFKITVQAN